MSKSIPLSGQEYGIYLSCLKPTLAYNLPLLIPVGKAKRGDVLEALKKIFEAHPHLQLRLSQQGEDIIKETVHEDINLPSFPYSEEHKQNLVCPFELLNAPLYRFEYLEHENENYLFADFHHILMDGFSLRLFFDELSALLAGKGIEKESFSCEDGTLLQVEALADKKVYEAQKNFYAATFDGLDCESIPSYDRKDETLVFHKIRVDLPLLNQEAIESFSKKLKVGRSSTFLSSFAIALAAFSNEDDALFATVNNGRRKEEANAYGMFVKTLPIYAKINDEQEVIDFVKSVNDAQKGALMNSDYSFSSFVRDFSPHIEVLFSYQGDYFYHIGEKEVEVLPVKDGKETISIELFIRDGHYFMDIEYRGDLFDEDSMRHFARVYEIVTCSMLQEKRVGDVSFLDKEEEAILDSYRIDHLADYDMDYGFIERFNESVRDYPDYLAISGKNESFTFKELDDYSSRIAQWILSKGGKKNDVASILIGRNCYMAVAPIGVIKAGVGYQPLDPSYPEERLNFMVEDSEAKFLIVQRGLEQKLEKLPANVLYLDEIASLPPLSLPLPKHNRDDLFVMLYTSGSTGKPKGVQLEYGNISIFAGCIKKMFALDHSKIFAAYASFGFDANMGDLIMSMTNGCTLHIIDEEMRLDLKAMNEYLKHNHVTHVLLTTQVGRQFATDYENDTLEVLLTGGEKLTPLNPPKHFKVVNIYGPTETTVFVTGAEVDKLYHRVPIGKAHPDTFVYILDKKGRQVPYGIPGELYISGPRVGRGYLHRDEENKKAFLKNPFTDNPNYQRFYKTGDIVRFLKDGTIDFIGRKDGQVKIRGFRIELSEVETVIRSYPNIKDCTVVAFPASSGGMYIAAYFVSPDKIDLKDLKAYIASKKPYYMVPEAFLQIDKIPLNQNSKVNKRALPEPMRIKDEIVEPRNEKEAKALQIARKIIGYDEFGVTADLFDAGLTSIASIKLITELSSAFSVDVSTQDIHAYPTVEGLVEHVLSKQKEEMHFALQEDYPLTKTQQGIFVSCLQDPSSTVYNIPTLFKLDKSVDLKKLENAIKDAFNAHPYLKTTLFSAPNGEIRAKRNDNAPVEIGFETLGELPKPFPLKAPKLLGGSLYLVKFLRIKEDNYLFMDVHHIVSDGTSIAVLIDDINASYEGKPLQKEEVTGFEIALQEQMDATEDAIALQKERYQSIFGGVDSPSLPKKDYNLPSSDSLKTYEYDLKANAKAIEGFLSAHRLTPNAFFNAVFSLALAKWNGNEDALYTTIYSGRDKASVSRSCVMLVKTLPVYAKIDEALPVVEFIKMLGKQIQESESMTLYSFADIASDLGIQADVMFAYQGDGFIPNQIGGAHAERIQIDSDDAKTPFSVDCLRLEKGFHLRFEYQENLYLEETMHYFAGMMDMISSQFLAKPALNDISYVDEQVQLEMDVYNQTDDPYEGDSYLDEFAREVKSHPEMDALIGIDETISYQELDLRSNKIANALLKLGVKKDDKVIMMMPRVSNAYVAVHGILKSGAAYLPIDPAYPDDRVLYIIEDSEAKILITSKSLLEKKKEAYPSLTILTVEELLESKEDKNPNVKIDPRSLAYCIYTSGSTGKPKGVMIEHHSLHNYVVYTPHNEIAKEYKDLSHVCLALASLSFDLSVMEEFVPLANGLTVLLASEDEILNPLLLAKRMKQYGADFITTTPSYVNNVLDIEEVCEAFRNLRVIDIGAEALPVPLIRKIREKGILCPLHNGYGPTEATVSCTMDDVTSEHVTIGYPTNNVKCYIIDNKLHRLPFGATGELLIGGDGVARGYIHREDLNKEKFITFEGIPCYRSGDLARLNYDGKIEFFGRKDNQVKLRGLRVELDEIEAQMDAYPSISRSVVLVKETPKDGQFLVGYFVASTEVELGELKKHLSAHLTPYMIPKVFMQLEKIPLTNNGKVDKKALPTPEVTSSKKEARMPRDEIESKLHDIFKKVLGVDELSIDDDFFELGGTSLSASKITMMAMEQNLPVAYSDVFDCPSVLELAANIKALLKNQHAEVAENQEITAEPRPSLKKNSASNVDEIEEDHPLGNVLLTGATGFLGTHVFRELYHSEATHIYALVRGNKELSGMERLKGMLAYYFDEPFDDEFDKKVSVIESDVTSETLLDNVSKIEINTIINCAALVKHFANDDSIERINAGGVKNLIEVALSKNARLIQVSTLSVAGENINGKFPLEKRIHENELYFGQDLSNKYVHSKYQAEEYLLSAVEERGLDGKIVRVGNLMGRHSDGEFQINSVTNNFMNSLKAYKALGVFPISGADSTIDFSAIDEVAKTIVLLAKSSKQFTVFHSANSHEIAMGDIIKAMQDNGFEIRLVKDAEFKEKLIEVMRDEKRNMLISSLLSYDSSDSSRISTYILSDNSFTVKALYRLGYQWPIVDEEYLSRSIKSLATLGFFDE